MGLKVCIHCSGRLRVPDTVRRTKGCLARLFQWGGHYFLLRRPDYLATFRGHIRWGGGDLNRKKGTTMCYVAIETGKERPQIQRQRQMQTS